MAKKAKKAKRASKPQAPSPKTTRTIAAGVDSAGRSRADESRRCLQIEKLGRTITWTVPASSYAHEVFLREAFIAGFEARVQQVNQGNLQGPPLQYPTATGVERQRAFEDGYHAAANQDGEHLAALGLKGSSSPADEYRKAKAKRR